MPPVLVLATWLGRAWGMVGGLLVLPERTGA
jgi:hypothetical protein